MTEPNEKKFLQETAFEEDYNPDKEKEEARKRRKLRENYPQWRSDS